MTRNGEGARSKVGALILDFDGTICTVDMGDSLCGRFADPSWRDADAKWLAGELSLPDSQREMWSTARATAAEAEAHCRAVGVLRDGFEALLDRAEAQNTPVVVASGGFEPYIRWILGDLAARLEAIWANALAFEGGRLVPSFPHADTLGCERCAVCKGRVCARYAERGPVVFVGDGASDACAVGRADELFAVAGSRLLKTALERGAPVTPMLSFDSVLML